MMKRCGSDVIQMSEQCEYASPLLVIPHLRTEKEKVMMVVMAAAAVVATVVF